jgi:RNA polymerase sigma factor (sigma-70 family)
VAVRPDRAEAEALCRKLQPSVFGALAFYCGSTELAEDLTQETMLRVWKHWETVSAMDRPDRWALRVGFNLAKSGWRRRRVERAVAATRNAAPAGPTDPADALVVRAAVAELPTRQRAAIVLRYFNDLSVADTATVLGCPTGTVKALTHQGIANLRARIALDIEIRADREDSND